MRICRLTAFSRAALEVRANHSRGNQSGENQAGISQADTSQREPVLGRNQSRGASPEGGNQLRRNQSGEDHLQGNQSGGNQAGTRQAGTRREPGGNQAGGNQSGEPFCGGLSNACRAAQISRIWGTLGRPRGYCSFTPRPWSQSRPKLNVDKVCVLRSPLFPHST